MVWIIGWLSNSVDKVLNSVDRASHKLYVSHRGALSVERLHALESYCRETSPLRVATVCLVLSVPPFLVSIALEFIPLANPRDGWRANYGAMVRYFCIVFFVAFGIILQSKALLPELRLSYCAVFSAAVSTATVCTGMFTAVASQWVFPIPFTFTLGATPTALAIGTFFVLAVGPRRLSKRKTLRQKVKQQSYMLLVQLVLVFVYCLFSLLYYRLPGDQKAWCVLILPIIKLVMQHLVAWVMRDCEQSQPIIVVFCIGVFNALFMSKCLQSAGSRLTYSVVISLDFFQSGMAFRRLGKTMNRINSLAATCDLGDLQHNNLLETVVQLSQASSVFKPRTRAQLSSSIVSSRLSTGKYSMYHAQSMSSVACFIVNRFQTT